LGRLFRKTYNDGVNPTRTITYTYDLLGRTTQIDDSNFAAPTTNVYDTEGRTTQIASPQGTINYEYDDLGRLMRTYSSKTIAAIDAVTDTRYTYDELGRLETVAVVERNDTATGEGPTSYSYDKNGNLDLTELPSGVLSDYVYDNLNRLDNLIHFVDNNGDKVFNGTDTLIAEYDYTVRADGKRTQEIETDAAGNTRQIDWVYDNLGRLTEERQDVSGGTTEDFIARYGFDLASNRISSERDNGNAVAAAFAADESTDYVYDANDRLENEVLDKAGMANDRNTVYTYNGTTQTGKTVRTGTIVGSGTVQEEQTMQYDVRGRLGSITVDKTGSGGSVTTTDYAYNDSGIRVSKTENGTTTIYHVDPNNQTGYAQVLEEGIDDNADGRLQLGEIDKSYALGHDIISQADAAGVVHYLLYDGHGSTRMLLDAAGTITQRYAYDAYGNLLSGTGLTLADAALTRFLYSGEQTDATGLQYLRARYYNPANGRFNRLDPFAGNINDPLSLHKYLYGNGDPVQNVDPNGEFSVTASLGAIGIQGLLAGIQLGAIGAAFGAVTGAIDAGLAGDDILNGALNGAKWGGVIGFGAGFLAPFATTFLSGAAQSALLNLGAGASITFGAIGAGSSFGNGNTLQGIFRLSTSFLGAYGLRRAAIRPTKPVNIGGEGELPNVINLQPRSALTTGYGRSQSVATGPQGRSLAGMILEGHDFQIYNASIGKLPYRTGSVPKVYTNNVPVDVPFACTTFRWTVDSQWPT